MAKRGGRSGRKYVRDSIGRFASKGYSGQTSGRGARLKAKGKKRDGAGAIVKPKRIGETKNTISKSSSKRKVNASSRATERQIARDVAARSKPTAARTSKAPANKAKAAYKRASGDARMRNADLRGADAKERRMANSASAKVKNMQRRRSTSAPKAGAEAPRSKQKAREFARIQRAYGNERRAYAAKGDGFGSAKQSRTASVAKRARDIYSGKISASYKTTSRLTRTQNPDVLKARIKKGEKLTAARAKKKSVTANSARATGKLTRPVAKGNIRRTGGRLGPKNTIKPGPKSPRTKMNRAIDNVIKKGKALKGSAEKLRGVKKQADALRGRMLKEDKGRLSKALSKPSVTDKRSRDYGGRLTKGARGQDPATGGKKSSARRKPAAAKPAAAKRRGAVGKISEAKAGRIVARMDAQRGRKALPGRRNANFVRTAERRSQFVLKPAATARKKGKSISVNESVQKAVANAAKRRKAKPAAAKPAAAKRKTTPKDGTDITREIGRAKSNKRIKKLNQQIKEAGPNAAGLRLEKLKVQTRMGNKPRQRVQPTAKQSAKEASRNDAIRKRSAELRAQSGRLQRNQANIQRLKNQSPKLGSRRLSSSQIKRQNRADTAKDIYSAPSTKRRAQIVRNQAGIARTERAKNNSMRLRSDRLAEAKATGLPMIKVTRAAKPAAAAKRKSKKVSADKVDRIIGRLSKDPSRKESIGMSSRATKSRNTRETRTRALDFINKAAGLKLKGKGSRPENPKGLDRGQMVSNIAGKLAKPTKRSTLKNNSKVVAQRQQVRKSSREATASLRSSVKRQSRSAGPSYAPGRLRVMPPRVAAASGTRPFYTDNKGGIFSGRTSFGSTKASRQSKLQSVRKLRGTGGLGSSISQIKRSKASQKTIGGGTQITFGRFRTGFQKRRRS